MSSPSPHVTFDRAVAPVRRLFDVAHAAAQQYGGREFADRFVADAIADPSSLPSLALIVSELKIARCKHARPYAGEYEALALIEKEHADAELLVALRSVNAALQVGELRELTQVATVAVRAIEDLGLLLPPPPAPHPETAVIHE